MLKEIKKKKKKGLNWKKKKNEKKNSIQLFNQLIIYLNNATIKKKTRLIWNNGKWWYNLRADIYKSLKSQLK